jgi:DNA-binding response OmpR family regulator
VDDRTFVLVASGDEGVRSHVRLTLGDERFDVHEAADTDDAVRAIATSTPSLLVLDLALPGTGALAIARSVRAQPETQHARTLILMQRSDTVAEDAPGVDSTLAFPSTSFALLRKVDELLGTI